MAVKTPVSTYHGWELAHKICNLVHCRLFPCKCQGTSGLKTAKSIWCYSIFGLSSTNIKYISICQNPWQETVSPGPFQVLVLYFPISENSWKLKPISHEVYCLQEWSYLGNRIFTSERIPIHKVHIY